MTKTVVSLADRFEQRSGTVLLSSMQALVRLPLEQARRDRAAGLATAGYITGYRGSPITTLDAQLWSAAKLLGEHDVHFEPGLNEELAATSLRGTQQLDWFGPARVGGVFAMWYAKGLGVDRACEALKLANLEGSHAQGGVLVVAGDDHAAKSSASAHQSEHTLVAAFVPVLAPATTDEILSFGLAGWAMSRFSGLYVGLKAVTDQLDLTATVTIDDRRFVAPERPGGAPSLSLRNGRPAVAQEALVVNERLPAAIAFARANGLNRVEIAADMPRLVLVAAGKAYLDVRQALLDLGLDDVSARALGIALAKPGMTWPLDPAFVREACTGAGEVLVIEEKRPLIEDQVARALYDVEGTRPRLSGKRDADGRPLLPADGVLDAAVVRRAIVARLAAAGALDAGTAARAQALNEADAAGAAPAVAIRPAFFCSGCPHNTSTNVPDGSVAMGATGCHGLAAFMPERRTMHVVGMGAEGLPWIGARRFVETRHVFANMGDGTYAHSGLLAIRAAIAAKADVTFKILYNDAVAMTGGQPAEAGMTPAQIVRELEAEGVSPIVTVSDEPDETPGARHRDELDAVQRELRAKAGVSAIVYVQTCANEKRRRRKRGTAADPDMRLWINPAVCEGCGDCSRQSNCMSILPLETEFGRKRRIDQSNCNKDYSCVKGFCPSFVSVRGGKPAKRTMDASALDPLVARLPEPAVADAGGGFAMLVTGIGGTGVLTVGAILGMAAHIEGKAAKILDMTGMAQKGGGVMSHIRVAASPDAIPSARLGTGQADVLLACDLVVASAPEIARTARPGTRVIANADVVPTGEFQTNRGLDLRPERFVPAIAARVEEGDVALVHANGLAQTLLGDTIFTNLMMVGVAAQRGLLPVGLSAIEEAVRLNGTAVAANLRALTLGRLAAAFPDELAAFAGLGADRPAYPQTLDELIASRARHLAAYQDEAYARRYEAFVRDVQARLATRGVGDAGLFLMAVAEHHARTLAYKDEYEVARLYTDPAFHAALAAEFDGDIRIGLNLGGVPGLNRIKDAKTGRPKKFEVGRWILPVFRTMAPMKRLRGTPLDPFGHTAERRMERRLIGEYKDIVLSLVDRIDARNLAAATEIAASAALIAGYGPVKEAGVAAWRAGLPALLRAFEEASTPAAAATMSLEAVSA